VPNRTEAWIALARMEQARKDHAAAREAAMRAVETARKGRGTTRGRPRPGPGLVAEAAELRRGGEVGATEALREAFDDLYGRVTQEPPASQKEQRRQLLLRAALTPGPRRPRRLAGLAIVLPRWHRASPAPNVIAGAWKELKRILSGWRGVDAPPGERIELVKALAGTRFFEEAALMALDPRARRVRTRGPSRATGDVLTPRRSAGCER